jgi:hypothetical protein
MRKVPFVIGYRDQAVLVRCSRNAYSNLTRIRAEWAVQSERTSFRGFLSWLFGIFE